jgi:hypothetical protein
MHFAVIHSCLMFGAQDLLGLRWVSFFRGSGRTSAASQNTKLQKHETRAEDNRDFQGTERFGVSKERADHIGNSGNKTLILDGETHFTSKNNFHILAFRRRNHWITIWEVDSRFGYQWLL